MSIESELMEIFAAHKVRPKAALMVALSSYVDRVAEAAYEAGYEQAKASG